MNNLLPGSLQARTTLVLAALCFGMVAVSAVVLFVYVAAQIVEEEHEELTEFVNRLEGVLATVDTSQESAELEA